MYYTSSTIRVAGEVAMTLGSRFRGPFSGGGVLVTGGCAGIGEAVVEAWAEQAITHLVVLDNDSEALRAAGQRLGGRGFEFLGICQDVGDPGAWESAAEEIRRRFGGLDYVVANAGLGMAETLPEITFEMWRRV